MGFLSPWLLLLAAAAAVPLLLHLMHRKPGPRMDFPALRYLRRAQKERGQRVRLRQLALLALRIAAVLFIALAAARPFLPGGATGHAPTAVAIVLDNSMSTGAVVGEERVFDRLREVVHATLDAAGSEDRFWLISAATPWVPTQPGDAATTRAALERVDVVDAAADLATAVADAAALLAAGAGQRAAEVHLVSDLQAASLAAQAGRVETDVIAWVGVQAPANHGIVDAQVGGGLAPRAGNRSQLVARLAGDPSDSLTVRLWLEGRAVGAAVGRAGSAVAFTLPPRPVGWVTGHLETAPDALPADDRRPFAFRSLPPVAVRLTGEAPFVRQALDALAAGGRIRTGGVSPPDVLISAAGAGLANGGTGHDMAVVVLPPSDPLRIEATNTRLAAAGIPYRYRPVVAGGVTTVEPPADDAELGGALGDARVRYAYDLVAVDGGGAVDGAAAADTLLRMADGRPLTLRLRGDARAGPGASVVLLVAAPLDGDATTIPQSAAMVPLLDRMTRGWTVADGTSGASVAPGTVVELPGTATALALPDGERVRVEGGAPFRLPPRSGLYRVLAGEETLAVWAVAPHAAESELVAADAAALRRALPAADVRAASTLADWSDAVYRQRRGGEWWRLLVVLLLAALLAESVLGHGARGVGRASRPPATAST